VEPEDIVAGMTVAESDEGRYLMVAVTNEDNGPALLVRRIRNESGEFLGTERITLGPGQTISGIKTSCPYMADRRFALLVGRVDRAGPAERVSIVVAGAGPDQFHFEAGPFRLDFGELAAFSFAGMGDWFEYSVTLVEGAECELIATVLVSGEEGQCNGVPEELPFLRGDINLNGRVDIADPVALLSYLFGEGALPCCHDAADGDDNGKLTVADPIVLLQTLFESRAALALPYPSCGYDDTEDQLPPCREPSPCTNWRSRL
jgi:hypothetical protein